MLLHSSSLVFDLDVVEIIIKRERKSKDNANYPREREIHLNSNKFQTEIVRTKGTK